MHWIVRSILQPDQLEELLDPLGPHWRSDRGELSQVGASGKVGVEGRRLDERADTVEAMAVAAGERLAQDLDGTAVGMDQPGEQAHRRRLPGPVRTQKAVHDAGRDGQVEPVEGQTRAVALAQPACRQRKVVMIAR